MRVVGAAGLARLVLCSGTAGIALTAAGAASAQAYYPGSYPPPAYGQGYDYPAPQGYAPSPYAQSPYAQPPSPQDGYSDPNYNPYPSPRYADPRSARQDLAYRRWANRYYGDGYTANYPSTNYLPPSYPPNAYQPAPAPAFEAPAGALSSPAGAAPAAPVAPVVTPPVPVSPPVAVPAAVAAVVAPVLVAPVLAAPVPAPAPAPIPVVERAEAVVPGAHLPRKLIEAAQAYADYMHRTAAISAAFKSGANVAEAVKTGAAYEPHQFQEGAIAYAALTALQEPEFVQGVRTLMAEGDQGALFAEQLAAQPQAALNVRGADLAAARAAAALNHHGQHLVSVGAQVKQAAYDVQHADWSKSQVADPDARLAAAKAASAQRATFKGDMEPELTKAVTSEVTGEPLSATKPSPIVTRGLAIAALAVLSQLHGDEDPHLFTLLAEPKSADCLKMAKLNLFQCLSVARPHYEDIFCLGEHGMMETGQCVVKAAGYTPMPVTMARAGAAASGRK